MPGPGESEPTVAVPPPIEVGDRLVGPLSPRQAGWLLVTGLAVLLAASGHGAGRAAAGAALAGLTAGLALLRPAGRCPEQWLVVLWRYRRRRAGESGGAAARSRHRAGAALLVVSPHPRRRWWPALAAAVLVTAGVVAGMAVAGGLPVGPARPARPATRPTPGPAAFEDQLTRSLDSLLGALSSATPAPTASRS